MTAVDRLLALASPALSEVDVPGDHVLAPLLGKRNGFYAFVSALHVLPLGDGSSGTIGGWNDLHGWRSRYPEITDEMIAFAEDIFGVQFLLVGDDVHTFDPETGELKYLATGIEAWCQEILDDAEYLTGYPMAQQWQEVNGPLPEGNRLVPVVPFVVGGEFTQENLVAMPADKGMQYRADLAERIRDLPDGSRLVLYANDSDGDGPHR